MKFDLTDFLELDTKALLAVNGGASCSGGSCSSGGSSYSGGGSCSSSSSYGGSCGSGSYGGSCSGSYGGSCGGSSVGSNGGSGNENPSGQAPAWKYVENSNFGVANANVGDRIIRSDGSEVVLTQGDIDWAKAQLSDTTNGSNTNQLVNTGIGSCGGSCGGGIGTGDTGTGDTGDMGNNGEVEGANGSGTGENGGSEGGDGGGLDNSNKPAEGKISASIQENNDKQYNYDTGYRCDNWVEEVLNDAGYDASDYLTAGNSYEKTVQQHIDALTSSKKEGVDYTTTLPTADGAYVVFMDDGKDSNGKAINEHAAILVIKEGKATVWDNSSGNGGNPVYKLNEDGSYVTDANGNKVVSYYDKGIGETSVKNNSMTPTWMYSTYYYQKIQ